MKNDMTYYPPYYPRSHGPYYSSPPPRRRNPAKIVAITSLALLAIVTVIAIVLLLVIPWYQDRADRAAYRAGYEQIGPGLEAEWATSPLRPLKSSDADFVCSLAMNEEEYPAEPLDGTPSTPFRRFNGRKPSWWNDHYGAALRGCTDYVQQHPMA